MLGTAGAEIIQRACRGFVGWSLHQKYIREMYIFYSRLFVQGNRVGWSHREVYVIVVDCIHRETEPTGYITTKLKRSVCSCSGLFVLGNRADWTPDASGEHFTEFGTLVHFLTCGFFTSQ